MLSYFSKLWHLELGRPGDTGEEAKILVTGPAVIPLALDGFHHFFYRFQTALMLSPGVTNAPSVLGAMKGMGLSG